MGNTGYAGHMGNTGKRGGKGQQAGPHPNALLDDSRQQAGPADGVKPRLCPADAPGARTYVVPDTRGLAVVYVFMFQAYAGLGPVRDPGSYFRGMQGLAPVHA